MLNRVYIASLDEAALSALVLQMEGFYVCGSTANGLVVADELLSLSPDLLVLDHILPGLDSLDYLKHLQNIMPAPPRILFINRGGSRDILLKAQNIGVDLAIDYPLDRFSFPEKLLLLADKPLPSLAEGWAAFRMNLAEEVLTALGVPPRLKGRKCLQTAIAQGACSPCLLQSLRDRLYPFLAEQISSTPAAVERCIRTAIELTWLKGNLSEIQSLFGFTVDPDKGKPTNAECIAALAGHVRRRLAHHMHELTDVPNPLST